ncbi:glycerophosphodiester phosphodiesterase [Lactiplantibacillus garii]|uniref:glycerophosphodiester phosphodiesterase n=1 Tax=Lactiplantibacillus garii TaxID=2306423 RepID=UPI001CDC19F8|nr:glycerophosphodiester phosphodiesterase [Lactiplantibacillus garii]
MFEFRKGRWWSRHQLVIWWLVGLLGCLGVKVLGLTIGGWVSGIGLLVLSGWVPVLAEASGSVSWSWRQRGLVWLLVGLTSLLWLPLGWGGLLATLQVSLRLPASFQNVIFNSRYDWLPVVGPLWGVLWLWSFKWLPSLRRQFQRPTTWRNYWRTGWRTPWWPVTKELLSYLPWLLGWIILGGLSAGLVWGVETAALRAAYGVAVVSCTALQLLVWWGLWHEWHRHLRLSKDRLPRWAVASLAVAGLAYGGWWLRPTTAPLPAVIAHRGVNGQDGVQNTTSALKRTVKRTQPNLVEMDIQPTADQHWVVMHDPTLKQLADRPGPVKRYRLKQLDGITLSEHGQVGRLSSFRQYLKIAEQLHQPLLVEVKAQRGAGQLMGPFADAYGQRLLADHGAVHSLDYQVIVRLRQRNAHVRLGWITPFYLTNFSHSVADFYSLQALTATREQVNAVHRDGQRSYFWTVDRDVAMQRLSAMGADGLITNRPGQLRKLQNGPQHYYFYQFLNWLVGWL